MATHARRVIGTAVGVMVLAALLLAGSGAATASPAERTANPAAPAQAEPVSPEPRPSRPGINPVGGGDTVVTPEPATATVDDLPTSGTGYLATTESLRLWVNIAVALLAVNAGVLALVAIRSWRLRDR